MKRFIYIPLVLLLAAVISGCSDFLNKLPENKYNNIDINYTNLGNMYEPVSGIYRTAEGENPGLVHWMDFGIRGVRGDDLDKGSSASDQSTLTDIKYFHNTYASVQSFWGTNNCWNDYYGLIIYANNALIELQKYAANIASGDAVNQKLNLQYQAEVRFIRAFAHLTISRIFGNVPILTDNSQLSSIGKSPIADVRKFISSEMDFCISNLEDCRPNQSIHTGAVTKYSALLLKAKVCADLAGSDNASSYWDQVISATDQIISSGKLSLFSNFYQLFKKPGKLCDESLFELQYSDFGTGSGTNVEPGAFWAFQGPRGDQRGSPISGWGFSTPSQTIVDFLSARNDSIRLKTTIMFCGSSDQTYVLTPSGDKIWGNTDGLKYFNGKAYLPSSQMNSGRTDYGSNNNVRVLRYADALLLSAEAKIRKGQNGDTPLNLVRNRAGLASITGANLQNVLDERRAEFACEWWGERYNDLLRSGLASTALSSFGFVSGSSDYIPIPQTQIDLDQNLK